MAKQKAAVKKTRSAKAKSKPKAARTPAAAKKTAKPAPKKSAPRKVAARKAAPRPAEPAKAEPKKSGQQEQKSFWSFLGIGKKPKAKVGLIPGAGGTQKMPRLMGTMAALPALLEGRSLNPQAALKAKLIDKAVPRDQLIM